MKKRRMLALALALALIMSLVPVSGLAAEPAGFMDPGAVMQEDTEESVNTEAVNGEEDLSPDTVGDGEEGLWQDPAESAEDKGADQALEEMPAVEDDGADEALEEMPAVEDDGADQALEEMPAVEDDGADQALEEMPAVEDDGADQALEEMPAVEDDGADQALEETPAVEDDGTDQTLEEMPAIEDDGADEALEETAAVEEENSEPVDEEDAEAVEESAPVQNEEISVEEAVSADAQETASEDVQETDAADTEEAGTADETAVPAEDGSAAESAADETAVPAENESLAETSANEVEAGYSYVLMNIPYAEFYAAEMAAGSPAVDAVASATKSKPHNSRLAGGSYHVNADGSDISGVIYPVKINSPEDLAKLEEKGAAVITDESSVEVSVPGRNGADPTITVYNGKDALFQAPDYSYYDLGSGIQSYFKELTVAEDGSLSFGAVKGTTTRAEAEVSVTANASHTYYEMKVTSDYVQTGDTVSAVVLTAEDGTTYGLRHMANLWRGTEIGFEADETFSALIGKKITGLKFITQNGIYNFTVDALIPEKLPEYVLMNIPYADFYAAELAQGSPAVDAVASATMSKPRSSLANGSYHVNADGSDISGVVYPVKVGKGFQLDPAKQVTDADSLSITVMFRGQEVTTEYNGRETLFEAPDYSWYALSAEEVPGYYKEARSHHGNVSFGAAVGDVDTASATAQVKAKARHADYEIKLTPDEGVLDQAADVVNAVVLTDSEGNTYGLRHVTNIWRVLEVGFNRDEPAGALAGRKITNIRYFKQNGIVDLAVDIDVPVLSTAVTLDKTSVSLLAGKTAALTAAVDPEQAAQAVTWTSSDENVVTVDENGVLTAVAAGSATVTAAAADNTGAAAVCEVTVTKPVSSIKLDKTSASILRGKTVALKATVSPDDAANKAVAWSSSDKKIATVDAKGVVTGVAKGTATITVKAKDGSGVKATCKITVKQPVTKITLSKTSASILRNRTITIKATAGPSSANDKSVAWTTSNKKVATVDSKGVVKGIAKGTATITATARDGSKVKATCKITVRQPVTKITLNKKSASILRNRTITLKATAGPSSANDKSVTWTTSNKKVATVNSKGVVKGIAKGTATITATAKDGSKVKAACKITVRQPVTKLTINKTKLTVKKGKTATLKVTVAPSSANDKSLKWTTSNKNIATVTQKGVVKGIRRGTVTITAAARDGSGKKVTCKITVQ